MYRYKIYFVAGKHENVKRIVKKMQQSKRIEKAPTYSSLEINGGFKSSLLGRENSFFGVSEEYMNKGGVLLVQNFYMLIILQNLL